MAHEKRKHKPKIEDLIASEEKREEIKRRLYAGDPIVGEGGIFTDMLQAMVNASLEGEMDDHLQTSKEGSGQSANRRNGVCHEALDGKQYQSLSI